MLAHQANGVDISPMFREDEIDLYIESLTPKQSASETNDTSAQIGDLEYRVIVICSNETQQAELLERFESEGLKCQALIS